MKPFRPVWQKPAINSEMFKWVCPVDATHKVIQSSGGNWVRCTQCKITKTYEEWKKYEETYKISKCEKDALDENT